MNAQHSPAPWTSEHDGHWGIYIDSSDGRQVACVSNGPNQATNAHLIVAAPYLLLYAQCEEARSRGEDIAETVLKRHGFDSSKCTATEFMDNMRRTAIAKATGSAA